MERPVTRFEQILLGSGRLVPDVDVDRDLWRPATCAAPAGDHSLEVEGAEKAVARDGRQRPSRKYQQRSQEEALTLGSDGPGLALDALRTGRARRAIDAVQAVGPRQPLFTLRPLRSDLLFVGTPEAVNHASRRRARIEIVLVQHAISVDVRWCISSQIVTSSYAEHAPPATYS
jgi:hypothetical protein